MGGLPNTMLFPRELREAIPDLPTCMASMLTQLADQAEAGIVR
jgi:hypothetical protein